MEHSGNLELGTLKSRLDRLPYALTLSDISLPDQPLIYVNSAFSTMTGYGHEMLGHNCRFLQGDLPNDQARAELREALGTGRRIQVVLHNRRKNGEFFYNLLLLERVAGRSGLSNLAVGSQFDLGLEDPNIFAPDMPEAGSDAIIQAKLQAEKIRVERRRVFADAAVRLVNSWCIMNELLDQPQE